MKRLTLGALTLGALTAPVGAITQEQIDAAFGAQEQGATLTEVRAQLEAQQPDDARAFALGAVDFLLAGERMIQGAHRHGFMGTFNQAGQMMGPRATFLSWIGNDTPVETTDADLHAAVDRFVSDLATAEQTLSGVEGDFTCAIDLNAIRFDINADGEASRGESLRGLFSLFPPMTTWENGRRETRAMIPDELVIAFDHGDADWLRGYCHLLSAAGSWFLAHDTSDLFDHTGHVFFPKAKITYGFLPGSTWSLERATGMPTPAAFDLTDVLAFFGNMRLPVDEPGRMRDALGHLRASVEHGKRMWALYDDESDDDREWIPNPDQSAVFTEIAIDGQMRDAWLLFLDEADDVLHGRKVLRFWRGDGTRGIDVPRVFEEPREFDLLYWIQGSAAGPYLREGEFTSPGTWTELVNVFDRRVFRFAFWFN